MYVPLERGNEVTVKVLIKIVFQNIAMHHYCYIICQGEWPVGSSLYKTLVFKCLPCGT